MFFVEISLLDLNDLNIEMGNVEKKGNEEEKGEYKNEIASNKRRHTSIHI